MFVLDEKTLCVVSLKVSGVRSIQTVQINIVDAHGFKTRRLRMDISGEHTSKPMIDYLVSKGIVQQLVPHANSPASNPAERQFQTLFRRVLTIKIFAQLPSWLWDELVDAVNQVDAALPVKDNPGGAPPDAMITLKRPTASHFKVIGCLCFVHKPASTMEAKGVQGTVVGYAKNSVGLRVLIAGAHYKDRHAIVESNSVICREGLRGINGTSFDGNIIITTTDGFDNFGLWQPRHQLHEKPVSRKKPVTWEVVESVTPTPGGDQVVEGSIPSGGDLTIPSTDSESTLTITSTEPDAIILDQHLQDRDIGDVMDAAYKGNYIGTRSRHKGPLLSMTDSSTFDFHANQTSAVDDKGKIRNSQPKGLLAASVKGGIHSSIYRSVTGVYQILSNTQRFDAIGGKPVALRTTIENDPRCAEAWLKEVNGLLESGNLVMMNIKDVPRGYKAIGYSGVFKHKYNPITKQYTSTRARFAPHGFRQIKGRDLDPDETAAPTLSMEAVHLYSMFMATKCPYKRARDVVSAFTSVELKELIIVEWPVGIPYVAGKCMRLGKMCYGLGIPSEGQVGPPSLAVRAHSV